jgi:sigma-E factor negative regulatory protein RseC
MIEETAVVQSVKNHWVKLLTTQSSSCHQCNEADSCSTSILSKFFGNKEIELKLYSNISLKAGDEVLVGIEENIFLGLTFLIYFLPLCVLFIFALLGQFIAQQFNINNELPVVLFAVAGFAGSYLCIKSLVQYYFNPEKIHPVILKKL